MSDPSPKVPFNAISNMLRLRKYTFKIERGDPNCDLTSHILSTIFYLHTNGTQITFIWTPAHSAIPDNEIVDRAAKAAFINGATLNVLVADDLRNHIRSLLGDFQISPLQKEHHQLIPLHQ